MCLYDEREAIWLEIVIPSWYIWCLRPWSYELGCSICQIFGGGTGTLKTNISKNGKRWLGKDATVAILERCDPMMMGLKALRVVGRSKNGVELILSGRPRPQIGVLMVSNLDMPLSGRLSLSTPRTSALFLRPLSWDEFERFYHHFP